LARVLQALRQPSKPTATPSWPEASINIKANRAARDIATAAEENTHENQSHESLRRRPGEGAPLLYRSAGLCEEDRLQPGTVSLAHSSLPEQPDGTELQLALNNNPAAKTFQQAIFQQNQPAANFFTDDIDADYERMRARNAEFTMPPTDVTASMIAMVNDTCGNLIQLTQLKSWNG
jgi:hypothetical protein